MELKSFPHHVTIMRLYPLTFFANKSSTLKQFEYLFYMKPSTYPHGSDNAGF